MTSTIQTIKSDFDKVISFSQGIDTPQTQELLEKWYNAKKHIIDTWGGKLIIESNYPVSFDLSEQEKRKRLGEFISTIENTYDNPSLAYFLEMRVNDFFKNHLSADYYTDDQVKIAAGTKMVKAFKYFESDERVLHDLQTQASMIIQEDKVSGIFCMSVHPLDYLSSSENTYHWRSCHALDGDYRAGNLSYMLDKSTIVCYLRNGSEMCALPNFPADVLWNSKKWRMLLFMEDEGEALFAGRQYPFFSPTALNIVSTFYDTNFNCFARTWSDWYDDYIIEFPRQGRGANRDYTVHNGRNIMMGGRIYGMEDLVTDARHSRHFDDLKYSSCYVPYYRFSYYPKSDKRLLHFTIGAEVPCLRCGDAYIDVEASMMCLDCEAQSGEGEDDNFTYCCCCERRVARRFTRWMDTAGGYICDSCYETETKECEGCGCVTYNCDLTYAHDIHKYLCPWCTERHQAEELLPLQKQITFTQTISFDDLPF